MGPGGQATRNVAYNDHHFGEEQKVKAPGVKAAILRLKLSISEDSSVVWILDRYGSGVQMSREEALEMMTILNRAFPLDALGQV